MQAVVDGPHWGPSIELSNRASLRQIGLANEGVLEKFWNQVMVDDALPVLSRRWGQRRCRHELFQQHCDGENVPDLQARSTLGHNALQC